MTGFVLPSIIIVPRTWVRRAIPLPPSSCCCATFLPTSHAVICAERRRCGYLNEHRARMPRFRSRALTRCRCYLTWFTAFSDWGIGHWTSSAYDHAAVDYLLAPVVTACVPDPAHYIFATGRHFPIIYPPFCCCLNHCQHCRAPHRPARTITGCPLPTAHPTVGTCCGVTRTTRYRYSVLG